MRKQLMAVLAAAGIGLFGRPARADDFHVTTAQELQSALTQAAGNGVHDVVYLAAGYYIGNFNFNSAESFDLTVRGETGTARSEITIDPDGTGRGLNVSCSGTANVTVQGITILRDCGDSAKGALRVATGVDADVLVENCRMMATNSANGVGVDIAACRDATVRECLVTRDGSSQGDGVSIGAAARAVLVEANSVQGSTNTLGRGIEITAASAVGLSLLGNTITGNNSGGYPGAGVWIEGNTLSMAGNSVHGNRGGYGPGVYLDAKYDGGSMGVSNNTLTANVGPGGALECNLASAGCLTISDNGISGNHGSSAYGGGVWIDVSSGGNGNSIVFTNNIVRGNTTGSSSAYHGGAGVYLTDWGQDNQFVICGNTITENSCSGTTEGGGLSYRATAARSSLIVSGNIVRGNSSGVGGGMHIRQECGPASMIVDGNEVCGNLSLSGSGGGIWLDGYTNKVCNNILAQNTQSGSGVGGGAWIRAKTHLDFINNTVSDNAAVGDGGGVKVQIDGVTEEAYVYNNIIWGNTAGGDGDDVHLSGTGSRKEFVRNDASGLYGIWDLYTENIDLAPLYADASNTDYHVSAESPCVNAGTNGAPELPSVDADGDPRIAGSIVDMGAYEFFNTDLHPADTNGNWTIESGEFTTYSDAWRNGQAWGAESNAISANYVTRAGYLLENGGLYHNDGAARPLRWKPGL
ncbi:MAG: hypothetical protein JXR37_07060 [Kiritimatiellae bacterium]|nr:hypothetical protein [Kiritimatiellia bacterium]